MTAQEFETQIRALKSRKPFLPFTVEYANGRELLIDGDYVAHSRGSATYIDRRGRLHFFDYTNVNRLVPVVPEARP
jgi:hypothetical protein